MHKIKLLLCTIYHYYLHLELKDKNKKNKIKIKGNVDAEIVLHTMIQYKNYDKAIIVSGDGDFHCLVEYLEKKGKLLKIITPNKRYSSLLKKFTKYIVVISALKDKLKVRAKKK